MEQGLSFNRIKNLISESHPNGKNLDTGKLSAALQGLAELQFQKNISPNIVDYDQSNLRLNIVDKAFLIWLNYEDKDELRKRIEI